MNTSPDNKREEPETLIFGTTSQDPLLSHQEQAASTASTTASAEGNTTPSGQQRVASEQSGATPKKPGVRFSTIIWGLIVAFAGALLLLGALGREFDVQLVSIVALGVSGLVLLVSAIARSIRS